MTLSRRLAAALRELRNRPLPPNVAQAARLHFLDSVGVGLAATATTLGAPYRAVVDHLSNPGGVSVFGSGRTASPDIAALVNGGLIHSLEYDDTHTASIVHGSSVLTAVSLAAGQSSGASGAGVLGAYARGWEVFVRLGLAAPGGFQREGFQITSVAGTMVAALVAADIGNLDEDATVHALGIALSQSSGVFEFLTNGSSVKSLHPGWAAHAGVLAAQFAAAGMTGPETAFEGERGLFRRFAASADAAERLGVLIEDMGVRWHLPDCAFKFQPCCHYLHPFIEATLTLRERNVRPHDVVSITCRIAPGAAPIVCAPWHIKQEAIGHQARWSLPVVAAAALHDGAVTLDTFETDVSEGTRDLTRRIIWEPLEPNDFPNRFEAELTALLKDGSKIDVRLDDVYGNMSRPATVADVLGKFRANAGRALEGHAVGALEHAMLNIDKGGFERLKPLLASPAGRSGIAQ